MEVAKYVKSNAIVYVKNKQTMGIGAGQMSRVISAEIANLKAKEESLEVTNSVMASDAFFPFRDGIDKAAEAGFQQLFNLVVQFVMMKLSMPLMNMALLWYLQV